MTDQDIARRLVDLERELHLSWQNIDAEARKIRHVTIELLKIASELKSK